MVGPALGRAATNRMAVPILDKDPDRAEHIWIEARNRLLGGRDRS